MQGLSMPKWNRRQDIATQLYRRGLHEQAVHVLGCTLRLKACVVCLTSQYAGMRSSELPMWARKNPSDPRCGTWLIGGSRYGCAVCNKKKTGSLWANVSCTSLREKERKREKEREREIDIEREGRERERREKREKRRERRERGREKTERERRIHR